MEKLIDGEVPAVSLFSGPYYFAEQLGFRKVIDTTFMMASMITGEPDLEDVRRYFGALRRAQHDIDLRPELYTRHYRNEFPERFHAVMDTRRWGPGERLVFEPYTKDVFEQAFNWIAEREIFPPGADGRGELRERGAVARGGLKDPGASPPLEGGVGGGGVAGSAPSPNPSRKGRGE